MLEHVFIGGEFMPRERLLSGLDLEQVTARPGGVEHSIFDELWHAAEWQRIVVERDEPGGEAWAEGGNPFPASDPTRIEEWRELVEKFLRGARQATEWGAAQEGRGVEVVPGWSVVDVLASLAVHNAYHLGKIVALRQVLGAWPPPR
jgi:uncharacterized damage-inducible protein DinB